MRWALALFASCALAQTPAQPPLAAKPPDAPTKSAAQLQRESVAKQKEAIRAQAKSAGVWLIPGGQPPQPPCDPIDDDVVNPIIDSAAKAQQLEPTLVRAVIQQESAFRPCAISFKGAEGLMQLMPDTAEQLSVEDPFDPKQNIEAGTRYLKQLIDKYKGDLEQALGAYNAGPATVDQAGKVPDIPETRDYVKAILDKVQPKRTDPPSIPMPKPIEN
jgi:soluble lytic murein transglycosylase-like protein